MRNILKQKYIFLPKRRIALLAAVLCCIAIIATGTLAYFTAEETSYNVITAGSLAMELKEETTDGKPFPSEDISGIVPGRVVDKVVYMVNTGEVDFYARIALGNTVTAKNGAALSFDKILLDINTEDWTDNGDGYYYYNSAVAPGEETTPLFTTVSFGTGLDNRYMNAEFKINVKAQAVQSKNNGTGPLDAKGWTDNQ